jgi:3-hydroxybutyryl-CoA dehydrogenase
MNIRTVGVLGCGPLGSGVAQVTAQAGYRTIVREVDERALQRGMEEIRRFMDEGVEKGKLPADLREATLARLSCVTAVSELADCDIIIEAVVENATAKKAAYAEIEPVVRGRAIFVSNTSSLCIMELAAATTRPDRFAGLHFFYPAPLMRLVEVIRAVSTSDDTYTQVMSFAKSLGKEVITAPDRPGFTVNRLLVPYLLDAIRAYESGLGTVEDIDKGMALGCGYPMGPFTLLDFIGLDTTYQIANIMFDEYREQRFAPPPLLKRMVMAGRTGRKSGRGFYDYSK